MGKWLHLRPRRVRAIAVVGTIVCRNRHLHGGGDRDRIRRAAYGLSVMAIILQFAIGLIFGLGLVLSGISDPAKVLNFLDLAAIGPGTWDASLAFVMAGGGGGGRGWGVCGV